MEFFEKNVRPLLASNCYACHGSANQMSGLRLDSMAALLQGGQRGPAVVPGRPQESLLLRAARHEGLRMPPTGKLPDPQIAALAKWIEMGAPWPAEQADLPQATGRPDFYEDAVKQHWAFQPLRRPALPEVRNASWSDLPVDRFILAGLEKIGLAPSARAGRRTLIRRLSFVLTGLPPTAAEVDRFAADPSAGAYERLVDRLLASPHFGEHWARHWMDVMRFGETLGNDWNYELHGAWLYRDYLIRAFNQDLPYDQLVREHIAGDLLEKPRLSPQEGVNESLIGPAFFRLGEQGHDDCIEFREVRTDVVDNQIDTLGKAFQGLTIACARCHDHKLDPIPTEDYYALYGILTSSRQVTRTIDTGDADAPLKPRLRELKDRIQKELAGHWTHESEQLGRALLAAEALHRGRPQPATFPGALDQRQIERMCALLDNAKSGLEDPLFPWIKLAGGGTPADFAEAWRQLAESYRNEREWRAAFNREHFQPLGDFRVGGFAGWYPDGRALDEGGAPSGAFAVATEGPLALTGVYPAGIYTHLLSDKLNGALRSPYLPKDKKFISLQVMGGKLAARRIIIDNCMLSEAYELLNQDSLSWIKLKTHPEQKRLPEYVELVTKSDNPRLPDRPGRMENVKPEQMASPRSYFGIARAVVHDCDETPQDELTHLARLFEGPAPTSPAEFAERYAAAAQQALAAWVAGKASDDDARWVNWLLRNRLVTNSPDLSPRLRQWIDGYRAVESQIAEPRVVYAMADLDPGYDFPLLPRGDAKNPGKAVPRGYLSLLAKSTNGFEGYGSGRRELAALIASPDNPLTARVMVNRVWHYVFGRGIVPTLDNFGRFGESPSHPELLDDLAARFIDSGWSVKSLIRLLVLSETFQQSSRSSEAAAAVDPDNRWLHRYPVRRLEAESIRDAVLVTSGRYDGSLYGPSIHPYREAPKDYRKLYSGPLDGNGRRSIYLKVTRHEGPRFLELFDFPNPMVARGSRDVTNVPSQALAMLNDPFVVDQAAVWADRLLAQPAPSLEARLDAMFHEALGRSPEDDEQARFRGLVYELASLQRVPRDQILTSHEVWKDVAHAIFNLKEFIYLR